MDSSCTSKSYAFLVHGRGPAVGDFGFDLSTNTELTSSRIIIKKNKIENMKCWTNEIPGKNTNHEDWEEDEDLLERRRTLFVFSKRLLCSCY